MAMTWHTVLLVLKIIGITLGALAVLAVVGVIIIYALATSGGRNPFQ
jgi:hypothetical protein